MATVYADTTVLAGRIFAARKQQAAIDTILDKEQVCTCRYVIEEFRCTFLEDLVGLHRLLVDSRTTGEALRRVTAKYCGTRQRGRIIDIIGVVLDIRGAVLPIPDAIDAIEKLIEWELLDWFKDPVTPDRIVDSTGCQRSDRDPVKTGKTYDFAPRCRKADPPRCHIVAFYNQHQQELCQLGNGPNELDNIHKKFRETVRQVLCNPNEGRGENCFGVLADAIITLEAPSDTKVCSTNASDFQPLCATLGKEFLDARSH